VTDYTWPSAVIPSSCALSWLDNTVVFKSPLSGSTRTESRAGGRWRQSITVQGLTNKSQSANPLHLLEGFLFRLNGAENRAVIKDFAYSRSGPGGGTPLVRGASQTGLVLITDGWPVSTTVLYAGDRIGISNQMIPLAANATTDGTGIVSLSLAHPIRTAPANNASIEIDAPNARYILTHKASFSSKPATVKTVLIEFEEAIP